MILSDTGVIVATIATADQHHPKAIALVDYLTPPLVTTWPCLTEAMYLLGAIGPAAQAKLRQQIRQGLFSLPPPSFEHALRACELMQQYADIPMDFADASLVVAAETLSITRILTFDRHFYAYRINDKTPFKILPG